MIRIGRIIAVGGTAARVILFGPTSDRVRILIRLMRFANSGGYHRLAVLSALRLQSYGLFISPKARIGAGIRLPHPTGIVIGEGVRLGNNVTLYQSVTLGGRRLGDWRADNYPTIGDNTVLFAGAVVVGKITIGKNCVIGANSVVTTDIPDNATAVGAPARVVRYQSSI